MKHITSGLLFAFSLLMSAAFFCSCTEDEQTFQYEIGKDNSLKLTRMDLKKQTSDVLLESIKFGLKTEQIELNCGNMKIASVSPVKTITEPEYTAVMGKKKIHAPVWQESVVTFEKVNGYQLSLILRTAKDGFAFRYQLNSDKAGSKVKFLEELTTYKVAAGTSFFAQDAVMGYEECYTPRKIGDNPQNWNLPILFHTDSDKSWGLLAESDVNSTYCVAKIRSNGQGELKQYYPGNGNKKYPVSALPWKSPWRCVIAGELKDIVESTMIDDLCPPSVIADTSWIKPGKAAWVYWAHNHGSKDYQIVKTYIDLAADMKWPYVLIDAEWDEMGNGGNINDAIAYAKSKKIDVLLWYNSYGNPWTKQGPYDKLMSHDVRVKEFAKIKGWGVKGIKADFFDDDIQESFAYYEGILKDAVDAKLLVNFHGSTIPHGWSRTYPNLVSMEGVYGAEQYNNGWRMTEHGADHNTMMPFTRNVIGPMDYTPTAWTDSQHKHTTSHTHELALPVIFESGIQHMADRPSGFLSQPKEVRDFLTDLPTTWDETKFIEGYPGKWIVLARRNGNTWYIAGINGAEKEREIVLPELLKNIIGNASARSITDGADGRSFLIKDGKVSDFPSFKMAKKGGFILVVKK